MHSHSAAIIHAFTALQVLSIVLIARVGIAFVTEMEPEDNWWIKHVFEYIVTQLVVSHVCTSVK
jgi:succinate dehydrogenase/fumarate reductase cytochrome b subunit